MYLTLKHIHVTAVALTAALFLLRGLWMVSETALLQQRWIKIAPHIIDTVLLASALALMFTIRQYPFSQAWLTAKVIGLLLYIALGMVALHYGKTRRIRLWAWIGAMMVFAYIVLVALAKNPWLGF